MDIVTVGSAVQWLLKVWYFRKRTLSIILIEKSYKALKLRRFQKKLNKISRFFWGWNAGIKTHVPFLDFFNQNQQMKASTSRHTINVCFRQRSTFLVVSKSK
jgi:hypothetical protein